MKAISASSSNSLYLLLMILGVVAILYVGLTPAGIVKTNSPQLSNDGGLQFSDSTIAYTAKVITAQQAAMLNKTGFSIKFRATIPPSKTGPSQFIFEIPAENAKHKALTIWQWHDHLIVMNGDDFNSERKEPKISYLIEPGTYDIKIMADPKKTRLFIDNKLVKSRNWSMKIPVHEKGSRIVLGNSAQRKNSWKGKLYNLEILPNSYKHLELTDLANKKAQNHVLIRYDFTQAGKDNEKYEMAADKSNNGYNLHFPKKPVIIQQTFFSPKFTWSNPQKHDVLDIVVNILGFIPFGMIAILFFKHYCSSFVITLSLLSSFLLSFTVEFSQAWVPSRYSSLQDLILNVFGAFIGVLLFYMYRHLARKRH